uniref:Uncharacterized protein n=1 Tax=Rhizophora mucronata TaxID=61149 RepID=A0A2P2KEZ1_RHIMU
MSFKLRILKMSQLSTLTCLEGSSLAVQLSMSLMPRSKRGLMTPHLFNLPFSSTTIFPAL